MWKGLFSLQGLGLMKMPSIGEYTGGSEKSFSQGTLIRNSIHSKDSKGHV